MAWWRARRAWEQPKLSVVVPVFNVERFLPSAVESIQAQGIDNLEILIINDGSTDSSLEVARGCAAADSRIRVLDQKNGGVSSARNTAMAECSGDLVTFVDPDDTLPPGAWKSMISTLLRTGSDLVIGSMRHVDGEGRVHRLPLLERNHAVARERITLADQPLLLADVFPCNKMFRMDFWRRLDLTFPVDVRYYEDQTVATEAMLAASSLDVLSDVVYEWHVRGDKSSATQARAALRNLEDRLLTKQRTIELVLEHGDPELLDVLWREVLPIDMWEHFRAAVAPTTELRDRYWETLREGLLEIWPPDSMPFERTHVPPGQRLMGWLVSQDRRHDLATLIHTIDGPGVPQRDGRYLHPFLNDPSVPPALSQIAPR